MDQGWMVVAYALIVLGGVTEEGCWYLEEDGQERWKAICSSVYLLAQPDILFRIKLVMVMVDS